MADGGVNPIAKARAVDPCVCHHALAVMTTAGLYEASSDGLYGVGLPGVTKYLSQRLDMDLFVQTGNIGPRKSAIALSQVHGPERLFHQVVGVEKNTNVEQPAGLKSREMSEPQVDRLIRVQRR